MEIWEKKYNTKIKIIILIGLFAGMFLAVCWYAVIYIMTQTVKDADRVRQLQIFRYLEWYLRIRRLKKGIG